MIEFLFFTCSSLAHVEFYKRPSTASKWIYPERFHNWLFLPVALFTTHCETFLKPTLSCARIAGTWKSLLYMFGGTRCVTWSIDRIIHRHACLTWGVELIRAIFFIFFLYVWLTLPIRSLFSMFDFIRYVKSLLYMLVVLVVQLPVPTPLWTCITLLNGSS